MVKIWFDDVRPPPDNSWIWTKNSYDCFVVFARHIATPNPVSEMSFDHDLGNEDKSIEVANYIEYLARHEAHPRIKWQIHTQNPVGREQLLITLQRCDTFWDAAERKVS